MKKKLLKKSLLPFFALTAGGILILTSCGGGGQKLSDEPLNATMVADFTKGEEDYKEFFASGSKGYSWENGEPFNVWWKPENVKHENSKMTLELSEMTEKQQKWDEEKGEMVDTVADYYGAEARSEHYYGYGDYQVRMKPAAIKGTASTFFVCTGPYDEWYNEDGTVQRQNDHDEIDIEFLGKDTTKVQFNYFASGVGGHEYMYNLGFDASKEFHNYGFRWTAEYITWFVDEKPVYRVDRAKKKASEEWPEEAGRLIANYWCGTDKAANWMGKFENDYSGKAEYEWVKCSSEQHPDPASTKPTPKPSPEEEFDIPETGWEAIPTDNFGGWSGYAIDKTNGVTISHTEKMGDWACEGMDLAKTYNYVKFHIKNNDAANKAVIRLDLKDKATTGKITKVKSNGTGVVADGAVTFTMEPGEEMDFVAKLNEEFMNQMVIFLNSTNGADKAASGSITINNVQGIPGEAEPVETGKVKINDASVSFSGGYTIAYAEDESSMTASYTDLSGKSYTNMEAAITEIVGETHNTFTFKVKNGGAATAKVRVDVGCDAGAGNTQAEGNAFANLSAKYVNVLESGNDYPYGGADWFKVAAGETADVQITFKAGVAKKIIFFIDSSTWDDDTTHTGSVTFSNMALSYVEPAPQEEYTAIPTDGFDGWGMYTVDKTNGVTISHTESKANTWNCCGMGLASSYTSVKLHVKNNDAANVAKVRIDVKNEAANSAKATAIVANDGAYVNNGEAYLILPAGAETDVEITLNGEVVDQFAVFLNSYDGEQAAAGSITLTNIKGVVAAE